MKTSNGIKVPTLRIRMVAKALAPTLQCEKNCNTCPFYQDNDNSDIPWNCALLNARDSLWEILFCAWKDEEKQAGGHPVLKQIEMNEREDKE